MAFSSIECVLVMGMCLFGTENGRVSRVSFGWERKALEPCGWAVFKGCLWVFGNDTSITRGQVKNYRISVFGVKLRSLRSSVLKKRREMTEAAFHAKKLPSQLFHPVEQIKFASPPFHTPQPYDHPKNSPKT